MRPVWEAAHSLPRLHTKQGPLPQHGPSSSHIFCQLLTSSNSLPSIHVEKLLPKGDFNPLNNRKRTEVGEIKQEKETGKLIAYGFFSPFSHG